MLVIGMAVTSSCAGNDKSCFSPASNVSAASQAGAQGCACNPAVDQDVCTEGGPMFCRGGYWGTGKDGPCTTPDGGVFPQDGGNKDAPMTLDTPMALDTPMTLDAPSAMDAPWTVEVLTGRDAFMSCSLDATSSCPTGTICKPGQGCLACFTPTLNTDQATMGDGLGCPCDRAVDHDVCAQTSTGSKAIVCFSGQWQFVFDGPCMPSMPDASVKTDLPSAADGPMSCPKDSACSVEVGSTAG
jgi:hypothetical protein